MQHADLRAVVHASLLTPSPLERYRPNPVRRERHGDLALLATGSPGPDFNYSIALGPVAPERAFALAEAFFGDPAGYSAVVEVETAGPVEEELIARGWRLVEEEPALVLPRLPDPIPAPPVGLDIRRVTDEAGLADFRNLTETPTLFVPSLAAALDPGVALFVGYLDGRVVASSRLVCLGEIAELTGVNTAPEYRRRGLGTALTWAAIAEGAARGCTVPMLTASELGYPVYIRMGFVPVCTYRTYLPPAQDGE